MLIYNSNDVTVSTIKTTERKIIMKKLIAILLSIALLLMTAGCTGGDTESTEKETHSKPTEATEPDRSLELVGTWERTQTEVEDYVEETPAGQVTITITGPNEEDLQITYKDKEFPQKNYSDKSLSILYDGSTMGFGDVEWIGHINYTGSYDTTYELAIVDGKLVMRNLWYMDGAPCVSYETFRRVN